MDVGISPMDGLHCNILPLRVWTTLHQQTAWTILWEPNVRNLPSNSLPSGSLPTIVHGTPLVYIFSFFLLLLLLSLHDHLLTFITRNDVWEVWCDYTRNSWRRWWVCCPGRIWMDQWCRSTLAPIILEPIYSRYLRPINKANKFCIL